MVALFKVFAILGLLLFIYAYYHSFRSYQAIHQTYKVGEQQSRECGFEYLEKETGIHRLYEALTQPENPLQDRFKNSLKYLVFVIALLSVCVVSITVYYMVNDGKQPGSLLYDMDPKNISWKNIAKVGIYARYILLRAIIGVGLLVYFVNKQSLYIPDFQQAMKTDANKTEEEGELADPVRDAETAKELDRSVKATISRQWWLLTLMAMTIFIMKTFYVPNIPISPYMLTMVEVVIILGILTLTVLTKFYSDLQSIIEGTYVKSVKTLNDQIMDLLSVPAFKDYYVQNAVRQEKYSDEPFQEHQLTRIAGEGKLHYYMKHHATRNDELEFMTAVERGKSRSNKIITWSPAVFGVRHQMISLRQADAKMGELFRQSQFKLLAFFFAPLILLIYLVFHISYKSSNYLTLVFVIGLLVSLFIWVMILNMGSLVRPQDPVEENK
jgi:hypothetical protein